MLHAPQLRKDFLNLVLGQFQETINAQTNDECLGCAYVMETILLGGGGYIGICRTRDPAAASISLNDKMGPGQEEEDS